VTRKRSKAEEAQFRDENVLLCQKFKAVRKKLIARFPKIDDNLSNLLSVIGKNQERKKKRRRCRK